MALWSLFAPPPHERRLIPEGRLSGPMPWVVAIMIFLTILAVAAGLALSQAATTLRGQLDSQLIVQIVEANPDIQRQQAQAASARLQQLPGVSAVTIQPRQEVEALIAPWLGEGELGDDIPVPALVDVALARPLSTREMARVRQDLRAIAPSAEIDSSSNYVGPVLALVALLRWTAFALVALLALATAAAVVISARAALNTHRETIDIIHLLGGTDAQITRLFERRIALDALLGGAIGLIAGAALILLVGQRLAAFESVLAASTGLSWWNWLIIAAVPILGMVLAMLTARWTVQRALRQFL
jgi:cell division transport system permease protein